MAKRVLLCSDLNVMSNRAEAPNRAGENQGPQIRIGVITDFNARIDENALPDPHSPADRRVKGHEVRPNVGLRMCSSAFVYAELAFEKFGEKVANLKNHARMLLGRLEIADHKRGSCVSEANIARSGFCCVTKEKLGVFDDRRIGTSSEVNGVHMNFCEKMARSKK